MSLCIIDPHLHFFKLNQGSYHWLHADNPPFWADKHLLQRDFLLTDLTVKTPATERNNIFLDESFILTGFVHIEAGFDNDNPWRELQYLQALTTQAQTSLKSRTIASVNLLNEPKLFNNTLSKLQRYSSLVGVRHILDEQALAILSAENSQINLATLNKTPNFIFELQLSLADKSAHNMMPVLMKTLSQHQQLRFIINHAGFPPIAGSSSARQQWQKNMAVLARFNNVYVKCSGAEMIARDYTLSWFSEVVAECIKLFSINRVMLASNFPVCLLSKNSYRKYWQEIVTMPIIKQGSPEQKNALLHDNALRIYQL